MRKYSIIFSISLLLLSGCLQAKEHLTLNKDGTGTLEVSQLIPSGTITLVDTMLGGMVKGMSEAFGGGEEKAKPPESIAVEMFANKEQIIKKAEEAGVDIEFVEFNHNMEGKDLHVNYTFKFDDINKLLGSELIQSKFNLSKDSQDNLVVSLKKNPNKAKETEMQMAQFGGFKESEDFKEMPSETQLAMISGMKNFKSELLITLPNPITEVKGIFEKKDAYTAGFEVSGNILDPETVKELYALSIEPAVLVCSGEGLDFSLEVATDEIETQAIPKFPLGSEIKVYLKNGKTAEGMLMEQNQEYLMVDVMEISITYYLEEIEKVELSPEEKKQEETE